MKDAFELIRKSKCDKGDLGLLKRLIDDKVRLLCVIIRISNDTALYIIQYV